MWCRARTTPRSTCLPLWRALCATAYFVHETIEFKIYYSSSIVLDYHRVAQCATSHRDRHSADCGCGCGAGSGKWQRQTHNNRHPFHSTDDETIRTSTMCVAYAPLCATLKSGQWRWRWTMLQWGIANIIKITHMRINGIAICVTDTVTCKSIAHKRVCKRFDGGGGKHQRSVREDEFYSRIHSFSHCMSLSQITLFVF